MKKRFLAAFIAVIMVLSLLPANTVKVKAVDPASHSHDGWTAVGAGTALPTEAGSYYLTGDITLAGTWTVPEGTTSLCLNGHVIYATGVSDNAIEVPQDAKLNLYDDTTTEHYFYYHKAKYVSASRKYITWSYIASPDDTQKDSAKLIPELNDTTAVEDAIVKVTGGVITGADDNSCINVNGGFFTMYSGNITGNPSRHGVYVYSTGQFIMNGGFISGNGMPTDTSGGGVYVSDGAFTMNGGEISWNDASAGGGVNLFSNATFTMNGGRISNNRANVFGTGFAAGGGVHISAGRNNKFLMSGGEITGNRSAYNGGGVYAGGNATVILGGTSKISGNCGNNNPVNNLYLNSSTDAKTGTGTEPGGNGVAAPARGMQIGLTGLEYLTVFSAAEAVSYFTADDQNNYSIITAPDGSLRFIDKYPLYVSGTKVTYENAANILNDTTVSYDSDNGILTLNNASITGSYLTDSDRNSNSKVCAIRAGEDIPELTIELIGENTIGNTVMDNNRDSIDSYMYQTGIYLPDSDLRFTGSGSLTIYDAGEGIWGKNITFDQSFTGELSVFDYTFAQDAPPCAINSDGNVTISGGTLNLKSYNSTGITIRGDNGSIIINGGNMTVDGGNGAMSKAPTITGDYFIRADKVFEGSDSDKYDADKINEYKHLKFLKTSTVTTAPKARSLTYDRTSQALVTAGEAQDGTIKYALGANSNLSPDPEYWSTDIPTATDAGTYYVWYRSFGNTGCLDSNPICLTVEISKKNIFVSGITAVDRCYIKDSTEVTLNTATAVLNGKIDGDDLYLTGGTAHMNDDKVGENKSVLLGDYKLAGRSAENYQLPTYDQQTDAKVTISKDMSAVATAPTANTLTYNLNAQALVTAGKAQNGTMSYALGENSTTAPTAADAWGTSIPAATDAGTYFVWYRSKGDDNYSDTEPVCIVTTIAQKDIKGATVNAFDAMTYTGSEQTPVAAVIVDGTMTATGSWSKVTNVDDTTAFTANGNFTGTISGLATGMTKAAAPAAPEGLKGVKPTEYGMKDGKITGTTTAMEYSTESGFDPENTTDCTAETITGLSAGTYYVRYMETANKKAGKYATITVPDGDKKPDSSPYPEAVPVIEKNADKDDETGKGNESGKDDSSENSKAKSVRVPYLKLSKTLGLGNSFKLKVTNVFDDASVTFSSSDKSVATVDKNGVIKAVGIGKCTVKGVIKQLGTAYKFAVAITVKKISSGNRQIKDSECLTPNSLTPLLNIYRVVTTKKPLSLNIKRLSDDAEVTYSSEDETIATVSRDGVVTGLRKGYTGILITVKQNEQTYQYRVYVRISKKEN